MVGQLWAASASGGYLYSDNLSDYLRFELQSKTKFRNLCDPKEDALGLHRGDTYRWNVYSRVANRGGPITESARMPETQFTIQQRTLTIQEFGNSIPYTGKVEMLGEHDVKDIIDQTLRDDARSTFDRMAAYQFFQTPLRVVATGGTSATSVTLTTNSTVGSTNNVGLQGDHIKAIVDIMKERNIPAFDGDDYGAISHPTTYRPFKNFLEDIHTYTESGVSMIYSGEIGRYESTRFIEQNEIPKGHANDALFNNTTPASVNYIYTAADDAWNNGQSSWCLFFGADTVIESPALPEEIRSKLPQDYGRDKGIAYYMVGECGLCHTDATNARMVLWDSAA
jgi:N4-gp56 family major capsid protein